MFKSNHLINGTHKLVTVLSIIFNAMLTQMIYCDILSYQYPKTVGVPCVQVIIIGAFLFLRMYATYLIMFFYSYTQG